MRDASVISRRHMLAAAGTWAAMAWSPAMTLGQGGSGPQHVYTVGGTSNNPRSGEGDFIPLRCGRLLYVYSHFTSGAGDFAAAHLRALESRDQGATWKPVPEPVVPQEAKTNVMSVSLLRLHDGTIALFYLRKESLRDCRPWVRFSRDEAQTWSEPRPLIRQQEVGYYVLNNDRVVQLSTGRLVAPVSLHNRPGYPRPDWSGQVMCYLSDDQGRTWRRSRSVLKGYDSQGKRVVTQEPGVVELADGTLLMFCRTRSGTQYVSRSRDGGETWSPLRPWTLVSPQSPATVERVPGKPWLLAVWNDHQGRHVQLGQRRTPLVVAVSQDQGRTWQGRKVLEDDPQGFFCYTAIQFLGPWLLLAYYAGKTGRVHEGLPSRIVRVPLEWILPQ